MIGLDPGSDAAVRLLREPQVFESPARLVENVRHAVAALRKIELPVAEVLRFQQIRRSQVTDDRQVAGTAVEVGRIVPAAGQEQRLRVGRKILRNQVEMLDGYAVAV